MSKIVGKTTRFELRRAMEVCGEQRPAGTVIGEISTADDFDFNFVVDAIRNGLAGEKHELEDEGSEVGGEGSGNDPQESAKPQAESGDGDKPLTAAQKRAAAKAAKATATEK